MVIRLVEKKIHPCRLPTQTAKAQTKSHSPFSEVPDVSTFLLKRGPSNIGTGWILPSEQSQTIGQPVNILGWLFFFTPPHKAVSLK